MHRILTVRRQGEKTGYQVGITTAGIRTGRRRGPALPTLAADHCVVSLAEPVQDAGGLHPPGIDHRKQGPVDLRLPPVRIRDGNQRCLQRGVVSEGDDVGKAMIRGIVGEGSHLNERRNGKIAPFILNPFISRTVTSNQVSIDRACLYCAWR